MKSKFAIFLLSMALFLPLIPAGAQEAEGETDLIQEAKNFIAPWIDKAIGLISQIGALFGKTTGMRIGGTSVMGIAALVLANVLKDKAPSWVKYLLYAGGGTMFAGSGANIAQMVLQNITQ